MKKLTAAGLFMTGIMVAISPALGFAGDTKISGFGDIQLPLSDEATDKGTTDNNGIVTPCTDGNNNNANCTELQFSTNAEVDFERTQGDIMVRLDLDIPGRSNTNSNTFADHIEQMKFVWSPEGAPMGMALTGGVFNTPIGYEGQDAIDLTTISNGQLFGLLPVNHAGLQLSAEEGPISGNLLFVNDWNGNGTTSLREENSIGVTASFNPMPVFGVTVGWISSEGGKTTGLTKANGDLLDIIVSGTVMPSMDLDLNYAVEYVSDDNRDAYGITVNAQHGHHGLTVRYDSVDPDGTSASPTSLTVALACDLADNLGVKLEWRTDDPDTNASSTDKLGLQFLARF